MYLHLFKCARSDVYAATTDSRGSNLPAEVCREGWRYLRGVTVMPQDRPSLTLDPLSVLAGVEAKGFHLWGPGVQDSSSAAPTEAGATDDAGPNAAA